MVEERNLDIDMEAYEESRKQAQVCSNYSLAPFNYLISYLLILWIDLIASQVNNNFFKGMRLCGFLCQHLYDADGEYQLLASAGSLPIDLICYNYLFQITSQATTGNADDQVNLDVHAINELQTKKVPATDDAPKYAYSSDDSGTYCESVDVLTAVMIVAF